MTRVPLAADRCSVRCPADRSRPWRRAWSPRGWIALGLPLAVIAACGRAPEASGAGAEPASSATPAVDPPAPAGAAAAPAAAAPAAAVPADATVQGDKAAPPIAEHDPQLVRRVVEAYERVRSDLYEGDFRAAKLHAIDVGSIASERRDEVYVELADAARSVTQQRSIDGSRTAFQTLSRTLWAIVADTPVVAGAARGYGCTGVGHERWLQIGPSLPGNPYRGRTADACADELPLRR